MKIICEKRRSCQSGQSLVEVLVALTAVVLVVVALAVATMVAISSTDYAKRQQGATKYAQESMEKARNYHRTQNWTNFRNDCGNYAVMGVSAPPVPLRLDSWICTDVAVVPTPAGATVNIKQIRIVVEWTDDEGDHEIEITDRFAPR